MSLQNLQSELADVILTDGEIDSILPSDNIQIYKNNVIMHLTRTLEDIYPLITQLLGKEFFVQTAKEYINSYPSRSGNIHEYGEYFGDFLAEYPLVKHLVYLSEVALFEWTCHYLSFAASHAALNIELLEKIAPENFNDLRFLLHPASRLIQFHYPILNIIDLCKQNFDDVVDIDAGGVNLLIIRRDLEIMLVALSDAEYVFLKALESNEPISQALAMALSVDEGFRLDEKLSGWIKDKTIIDCY